MDIDGDRDLSPEGDEGDMEQTEEYEEEEEGGENGEEEEGEGEEVEDVGPPPRPGRRVTFEQQDKLAVEFQERELYQRSESGEGQKQSLVHVCRLFL